MSEEAITFPDAVLKIAAQYARRRKMPSGTVSRYESGGANNEPIVQVIGQAYLEGQKDPLSNQCIEEEVGCDDYTKLALEVESLNNRIKAAENENNQLKYQLADAGGEVVILKTQIKELEVAANKSYEDHLDIVSKLTKQLVDVQTVIRDIKMRCLGKFWNRNNDIFDIANRVDISNR